MVEFRRQQRGQQWRRRGDRVVIRDRIKSDSLTKNGQAHGEGSVASVAVGDAELSSQSACPSGQFHCLLAVTGDHAGSCLTGHRRPSPVCVTEAIAQVNEAAEYGDSAWIAQLDQRGSLQSCPVGDQVGVVDRLRGCDQL